MNAVLMRQQKLCNGASVLTNVSICRLANGLPATAAQFKSGVNAVACVWFMHGKLPSVCNSPLKKKVVEEEEEKLFALSHSDYSEGNWE